jgi:3-methyladenine DNA glycosylase Mpg
MKQRNEGFLSEKHIDQSGEIFDYIRELHSYLWRIVRTQIPSAQGKLCDYLDVAMELLEKDKYSLNKELKDGEDSASELVLHIKRMGVGQATIPIKLGEEKYLIEIKAKRKE